MTVAPDAINMEKICKKFGGEIEDGGGQKKVCSGVDANDTFCIIADKDAFPCLGLLEHVRKCNCEHNRPALNPFFCGGKCNGQEKAVGSECLLTDDAINKGYIYPVGPIPLVANYAGDVFAVSATINGNRVAMELSHSAFTFSFASAEGAGVGTVGVRPDAGLQGVALSRYPVTLSVRFTSEGGQGSRDTRVYIVTAVAKPGELKIYNSNDRGFVLPTYGYPDLAYQSSDDDGRKIVITDGRELFWPNQTDITARAVTLTATSSQFLGDLLLPLSEVIIGCKQTVVLSPDNMSLVKAAKEGEVQDACNAIQDGGADPKHLAAMTAAFDSITDDDLLDGKQDVILLLLSGDADANKQFPDGDFALHKAVKAGDKFLPLAQALAGYGADLNPRNGDGETPLMLAAESSDRNRILDYLVGELAGGLDRRQVQTSMALGGGDCDTDENCTLKTALHYAVDGMNLAGIRRLVEAGASAIELDNAGKAPIHYVAENLGQDDPDNMDYTYSNMLCALLSGDRQAQLDVRTSDGDTAEDIAKEIGEGAGKLFELYSSPVNCRR